MVEVSRLIDRAMLIEIEADAVVEGGISPKLTAPTYSHSMVLGGFDETS